MDLRSSGHPIQIQSCVRNTGFEFRCHWSVRAGRIIEYRHLETRLLIKGKLGWQAELCIVLDDSLPRQPPTRGIGAL